MKDYVQNAEYRYEYDIMDRVTKTWRTDLTTGDVTTSGYTYNTQSQMTAFNENISGTGYNTAYTYDYDKRPETATFGTYSKEIACDSTLGTVTGYSLENNGTPFYSTGIGYCEPDMNNGGISPDSARVETITNGGETLTYAYDDRGYILSVTKDANNYSEYRYDALGQLMRENYKWGYISYTTVYAYDVGGNITSKTKYDFVAGDGQVGAPIDTIPYTYDATWKDKLASYDGVNISYDDIGNPLDDGTWDYTWTQGRKLEQITDGITTASYKYNSSGIRTEKTVGGVTTVFNLAGSNITWQKTGAGTPIYFIYDSGGKLWGLKYTDGNEYFYVRNVQGDIIKIVDDTGAVVVEYVYDAWGKLIATSGTMAATLGADNPFRYRGYYYDVETGLYYLNARYYNPQWGRFINADSYGGSVGGLLSHNVFAYCGNNPVMMSDPSGHRPTIGGTFEEEDRLRKEEEIKKAVKQKRERAYRILLWMRDYLEGKDYTTIDHLTNLCEFPGEIIVEQMCMASFISRNRNANYYKYDYDTVYVFTWRWYNDQVLTQNYFLYSSKDYKAFEFPYGLGGEVITFDTGGGNIIDQLKHWNSMGEYGSIFDGYGARPLK